MGHPFINLCPLDSWWLYFGAVSGVVFAGLDFNKWLMFSLVFQRIKNRFKFKRSGGLDIQFIKFLTDRNSIIEYWCISRTWIISINSCPLISLGCIPPCEVKTMTVLLTVVMKSRNPKTVFVVLIALGSSAMSPESAYIGATCIASGSDHTGLATIKNIETVNKNSR